MSASLKFTPESFGQNAGRMLDIATSNFIFSYWISFFSDPLTVAFLLFWEIAVLGSSVYLLTAFFMLGVFAWTLMEYSFHRWVYHHGRTVLHAGHALHHEEPKVLISMPWFVMTALILGLWSLFAYWLQVRYLSGFMAGLLWGFFVYSCFHHVHHHFNLKSSWYRKLRAHHKIHHQIPGTNFGVTNRVWDRIFGTTYQKAKVDVKKRSSVPVGK